MRRGKGFDHENNTKTMIIDRAYAICSQMKIQRKPFNDSFYVEQQWKGTINLCCRKKNYRLWLF